MEDRVDKITDATYSGGESGIDDSDGDGDGDDVDDITIPTPMSSSTPPPFPLDCPVREPLRLLWGLAPESYDGSKPSSSSPVSSGPPPPAAHRLVERVRVLCHKASALAKLSGIKPSTAPVGTERLVWALRRLASRHLVDASAWRVLGAGRTYRLPVGESDTDEVISGQWQQLLDMVVDENNALIYHLENHYSLVYACREWAADAGYGGRRVVRQVLVARPGQRPCYWVDFGWIRRNVLAWKGHAIVGLSRLRRARVSRDRRDEEREEDKQKEIGS